MSKTKAGLKSRSARSRSLKTRTRANTNRDRIWQQFSPDMLRSICQMPEHAFANAYGMQTTTVDQKAPANFYAFKDNGSDILAVAHLDTVSEPGARTCDFLQTAAGWVVYSRALDDRLGAYVILDLLPKLGLTFDVLLSVGEETCESTAAFFDAPKDYNWIIEFDRGGTDVVMYQYEDTDTTERVLASGAQVDTGSFSDIAYLQHLGVKAFNWGVGYQDHHSARSHAYLEDTVTMVGHFLTFHEGNQNLRLPHVQSPEGDLSPSWLDDDRADTVAWPNSTIPEEINLIADGIDERGHRDDEELDDDRPCACNKAHTACEHRYNPDGPDDVDPDDRHSRE